MKVALILLLIGIAASSPAPAKDLQPFELAMLDKLHQPLYKPVKTGKPVKPEYPRKGETMCKGGVCKVKIEDCEDCQFTLPLDFRKARKMGHRQFWPYFKK